MNSILTIITILVVVKIVAKLILERLNVKEINRHNTVPDSFSDFINEETYEKSVAYSKAKSRQTQLEIVYQGVLLIVIVVTGVLEKYSSWFYQSLESFDLPKVWLDSFFLFGFFFLYSLLSLPFSLYNTFVLEQKYGFNTMTMRLWVKDFIKGFILSAVLTIPLLAFIIYLVDLMGAYWWIWAWVAVVAFQFLLQILYPKVIIPLFNKLTPLPEGELRDQILTLADKLNFGAQDIMVMDGSKRSKHSNAFFTGIGKGRRVVFFDTLVEQLSIDEMKAVFAHEVGHYKKKHIVKGILISIFSMLFTFFVIDWLMKFSALNTAFQLPSGEVVYTLLILSLFGGLFTFWFSPLTNIFSRKNEYEADAFAMEAVGDHQNLVDALKKLYKENLSNLTPHSWYSFFYYSHPTLIERENEMKGRT